MDAAEQLEPLCYGGEAFIEPATVDGGVIGITSHRVLVLTPEGPGARFHAIDRPNVVGFATRTTGPTGHRNRALVAGVIGVGLLAVGAVIDFDGVGLLEAVPGGDVLVWLYGLVVALLDVFGPIAGTFRLLGLLGLLAALGSAGWYLWKTNWVIEITVAGAENVRIPITRDQMSVVDRLETTLEEAGGDRVGGGSSAVPD